MGFDGFGVKISLRVSATSWDSWAGQGILPVCQRAGIGHCKTSKFGNSRDSQAKTQDRLKSRTFRGKKCLKKGRSTTIFHDFLSEFQGDKSWINDSSFRVFRKFLGSPG